MTGPTDDDMPYFGPDDEPLTTTEDYLRSAWDPDDDPVDDGDPEAAKGISTRLLRRAGQGQEGHGAE